MLYTYVAVIVCNVVVFIKLNMKTKLETNHTSSKFSWTNTTVIKIGMHPNKWLNNEPCKQSLATILARNPEKSPFTVSKGQYMMYKGSYITDQSNCLCPGGKAHY